jgi:hypothetical protein
MRNFAISFLFKREELCSRNRAVLSFKQDISKTQPIILYVGRLQLTTIFFPLDAAVFYPDGNSAGKTMEKSGKQNPKTGFKSPTGQRGKSNRPQESTPSIDFPAEGI